jgi:CubicO group peptidase (beta-lactamase class C family)
VGQRVDDYLRRAARFGFSGAVLVAQDGRVVLEQGYGLADREKGLPVTPNTVFSIGSLTKQFTAAAILSLEERKRLSTRDRLDKYFPAAPPDKAGITLHQLLTHTAGLPDALGDDFEKISRDSLIALAFRTPLRHPPGSQYDYSNVGYSVLAAIVEKTSGRPYEEYLRTELLDRAGLTETGYGRPWAAGRLAVGYLDTTRWGNSVERWQPDGPWWHVVGNGEIHSTVGDMYRWIAALDSGRVLTDSSRKKSITPFVPEDPSGETRYGYGWVVGTTEWGAPRIWHSGSNGIFYANVGRFPDARTTIIVLSSTYPYRALIEDLTRVVFELPAPEIPVALDSAPADLASFAGSYRLPSGQLVAVSRIGSRLRVYAEDPEAAMAFSGLAPAGFGRGNASTSSGASAARMLDRLGHGDPTELVRYLAPDPEPAATMAESWKARIADWADRLGRFQLARVVGSRIIEMEPSRKVELYAVLRFARGARMIRIVEQEGEGPSGRMVAPMPAPPAESWLAPVAAGGFAAYQFGLGTSLRVEFEPAASGGAMILHGPGPAVRATRVR